VPRPSDDDKEQEDQDLQDQTTKNNILASLDTVLVIGLYQHASTTALYEETQDVSGNEDLRDPIGAHD
jgi:hypothetical protein